MHNVSFKVLSVCIFNKKLGVLIIYLQKTLNIFARNIKCFALKLLMFSGKSFNVFGQYDRMFSADYCIDAENRFLCIVRTIKNGEKHMSLSVILPLQDVRKRLFKI